MIKAIFNIVNVYLPYLKAYVKLLVLNNLYILNIWS